MTLRWIAAVVFLFMLLAVPWWFGGSAPERLILGMPGWAVYSLVITLLFAVVVAWLLATRWRELEAGDDDR